MATPFIIPKAYFWDPRTGQPLAFGEVFFYEAGTSSSKPTYADPGGTVANQQPVKLNGAGYADIFLAGKYKVAVKAADGYVVWTADNVSDIAHIYEEWVYPTAAQYVSAVQFRVAGSMTDVFVIGRALKLSDAVTIYGIVTASYYSAGYTYVTVSTLQPLTNNLAYVSVSGATTATKFATPRKINGVPFDGTADITITANPSAGNQFLMPVGFMTHWASSTPPQGWLVRDGSAVSRTIYAALFAVLGTTFGAGNGSTTFNLPDDRGLVEAGYKPGDSVFGTLGAVVGSKDSVVVSHAHSGGATSNTTVTVSDSGHSHFLASTTGKTGAISDSAQIPAQSDWGSGSSYVLGGTTGPANVGKSSNATTGITATASTNTIIGINNAGESGVDKNVQPSRVYQPIIFTGVL